MTYVHEGSEDINNRWTSFSQVVGRYTAMSNVGQGTVDAAFDYVIGWMQSNMIPPWPVERARREFNALFNRDIAQQIDVELKKTEVLGVSGQGIESWAVTNWTKGETPPRKFLVNRLMMTVIPILFVSELGAGKTLSAIDFTLKAVCFTPHCNGATVVMITAEDDKDELHRRSVDCDANGLRHIAGNRLMILPLVNAGGSFPLQ